MSDQTQADMTSDQVEEMQAANVDQASAEDQAAPSVEQTQEPAYEAPANPFLNTPDYVQNGRFDFAYLSQKTAGCTRNADITWYRDLKANPVVTIAQKALRKGTSFYVGPAFDEQSRWNEEAAAALSQLTAFVSEQSLYIRQLEARVCELEKKQQE